MIKEKGTKSKSKSNNKGKRCKKRQKVYTTQLKLNRFLLNDNLSSVKQGQLIQVIKAKIKNKKQKYKTDKEWT